MTSLLSGTVLVVTLLATIGPAARAAVDGFGFLWPGGIVGILAVVCLVQAFLLSRGGLLPDLSKAGDRAPDQVSPGSVPGRAETVDRPSPPRLDPPPVEPNAAFGKRLRELRSRKGLTQEGLAYAADLHPVEIARMERGLRAPRLTTIARLAHGLEIKSSELLAGFS
jgi:DNA-binding XRE family transcriptional regulator